VRPAGSNAILNANIRPLTVNNNVKFGDEILIETENQLQYSVCGYFENLRTSFGDNGSQVSNIIGWAYDGNPIYGPYGYSDSENSNSIPKLLESGYTLNSSNVIDRPSNFAQDFLLKIMSIQILETWMKIMEDLEKLQNFQMEYMHILQLLILLQRQNFHIL
jgi:hypothetical protein